MKNLAAILVLAMIAFIANLFKTEQKMIPEKQVWTRSGKIIMLSNERKLLINEISYKNAKNEAEINELKNK